MKVNYDKLKTMSEWEAQQMFKLAFGRILRMGSRQTQPGDIEDYETCKHIIYQCAETLGMRPKQ